MSQALNFDRIVQSKFHICNNENKVSLFKSSHSYFKLCIAIFLSLHLRYFECLIGFLQTCINQIKFINVRGPTSNVTIQKTWLRLEPGSPQPVVCRRKHRADQLISICWFKFACSYCEWTRKRMNEWIVQIALLDILWEFLERTMTNIKLTMY